MFEPYIGTFPFLNKKILKGMTLESNESTHKTEDLTVCDVHNIPYDYFIENGKDIHILFPFATQYLEQISMVPNMFEFQHKK